MNGADLVGRFLDEMQRAEANVEESPTFRIATTQRSGTTSSRRYWTTTTTKKPYNYYNDHLDYIDDAAAVSLGVIIGSVVACLIFAGCAVVIACFCCNRKSSGFVHGPGRAGQGQMLIPTQAQPTVQTYNMNRRPSVAPAPGNMPAVDSNGTPFPAVYHPPQGVTPQPVDSPSAPVQVQQSQL